MTGDENELAVGYRRLSQTGKSLPKQLEAIEGYCREHGLELIEEYSDGQNTSGYDEDREAYQVMLERLQEGDVGHVVARDRARFARDSNHRMLLWLQLDKLGVSIHIAETDEEVDLEDPYALTRESAQADADDVEKRKEAERGRQEAERRAKEGLPNGRPPFGLQYNRDRTAYVTDPEEFPDALEVYELRDGGASWRAIEDATEVNRDTARRLYGRRELYARAEYRARGRRSPNSQ